MRRQIIPPITEHVRARGDSLKVLDIADDLATLLGDAGLAIQAAEAHLVAKVVHVHSQARANSHTDL